MNTWLTDNYIEIFGAITGIIYVFLEIKQATWLWPVGIITSGVYVWIFFTGKLYADMSLQAYYVVIRVLGWIWWRKSSGLRAQGREQGGGDKELQQRSSAKRKGENSTLVVTRLRFKTGMILAVTFFVLYCVMYLILSRFTDSPVPEWDAFLTSLSIVATWMLARKFYEHWFLWIIVNALSVILYFTRGLYPTVVLYFVYLCMSFAGLKAWKKTIVNNNN
jgi:nicotinamide mononucleotide transporter